MTLLRPFALGLALASFALAGTQPDIEYAAVGGWSLRLDLHRPDSAGGEQKLPLVVYVHGGAWRGGSKSDVPVAGLLEQGFAIASVDYRLSTQARFPAQVHDIKAAIRYLRAKADLYKLDAERFSIVGSSAGGHLAALAGVSGKELEGGVGADLEQSSAVTHVVSYYGASNLESILRQSTDFGLKMRVPALELLLGGLPADKPELARLASPVAHLDAGDPPVLLIHGTADPQMPLAQSRELKAAGEKSGLKVRLIEVEGAKHGGGEFYDRRMDVLVAEFLRSRE